jgi:queuosine biosynthesis protein QueC
MSLKNERALVVFSGGQDSTTCLYWALERFQSVEAVTFAYGQRHKAEIERAREIAEKLGISWTLLDMSLLNQLAPSSLTRSDQEVPETVKEGEIPSTFVPGRNLLFLSFAGVMAYGKGIRHLVTGVCETDFSGYPDCRDEFIKAANLALNRALDESFVIHTPLMWLNKKETWALADGLGVLNEIRTETLTCYNGIIGDGCGNCPACHLRRRGLEEYLKEKGASK